MTQMTESRNDVLQSLYRVQTYLQKIRNIDNRKAAISEQMLATLQEANLIETEGMAQVKLRFISICATLLLFFGAVWCLHGDVVEALIIWAVSVFVLLPVGKGSVLKKAATVVAALYLLWMAVTSVRVLFAGGLDTVLSLIMVALIPLVYMVMMKAISAINKFLEAKNEKIRQKNSEIDAHNQPLRDEFNTLSQQRKVLLNELGQFCSAVEFPKDYVYLQAVNFFIKAIKNRRADSFKEVVNLYEQSKELQEARQARARTEALQRRQNELIQQQNEINYQNSVMVQQYAQQIIENQRQLAINQQFQSQLLMNGINLYIR